MTEKSDIKIVTTDNAAKPRGHYSQALVHNGTIYVAGQLGLRPGNVVNTPGTIEEQTELALRNIEEVLLAAGSGLDRLLKVTIYVADISLWERVNAVYTRLLGNHRPARAVIPCKDLHLGFQVAIDAIAAE